MTGQLPTVDSTRRYSIGETCALLGIHRNTLRRYTHDGKIKAGMHKTTYRTFYTGLSILKFWNSTI
ncbi:MAG: helix-turn-helix domain-containing protein [Clostridia bacterium]|nr:helix-turn-helix domain-containing protein [Clostridia bacterium]